MSVRVVVAPPYRSAPIDPALLTPLRDLPRRFPAAGLRELALVRAAELDPRADPMGDTRVWLALEALQITGSFKIRGALVALDAHAAAGRKHVVVVSAGNHGAGVALAAKILGMKATVVVPRTAPLAKRAKIERAGAELLVSESDGYDAAEIEAKALAKKLELPFVSPYDDLDVLLGNGASIGFEMVRGLGGIPDRVICPVGGSGLATGLAWALADEAASPGDARVVWGAQSEASCAFAQSLERGAAVEHLPPVETFADGLEGGISASAFERSRGVLRGAVVATEEAIARAMTYAYKDLGLVLEGSAAVALAPLLAPGGLPAELRGGDLVVLLTGRNVDPDRLDSAMAFAPAPCY